MLLGKSALDFFYHSFWRRAEIFSAKVERVLHIAASKASCHETNQAVGGGVRALCCLQILLPAGGRIVCTAAPLQPVHILTLCVTPEILGGVLAKPAPQIQTPPGSREPSGKGDAYFVLRKISVGWQSSNWRRMRRFESKRALWASPWNRESRRNPDILTRTKPKVVFNFDSEALAF